MVVNSERLWRSFYPQGVQSLNEDIGLFVDPRGEVAISSKVSWEVKNVVTETNGDGWSYTLYCIWACVRFTLSNNVFSIVDGCLDSLDAVK